MKRLLLLFSCVTIGLVSSYAAVQNPTISQKQSKGIVVKSKGYPFIIYLNGKKQCEPTNNFTKSDLKIGQHYQIQIYRADSDSIKLADDSFVCDSAGSYMYSFSSSPNSQSMERKFQGGNFSGYSSVSSSSYFLSSENKNDSVVNKKDKQVLAKSAVKSKNKIKSKKLAASKKLRKTSSKQSSQSSKQMNDNETMALMQKMYNSSSSKEQMKLLINNFKNKTCNVYQARSLANTFEKENDKMQAATFLYDKTSDKNQYYLLRNLFSDGDNRKIFNDFLEKHSVSTESSYSFPEDMIIW